MHNLSTAENGNIRFIERADRGGPAWHKLGTVVPANIVLSPEEATVMADCDYRVVKYPMIINLPTGPIPSKQSALVRIPREGEGSYHVLGEAGSGFEIIQNMELARMLDNLSQEWPVETVGALGEGEAFFITLTAGSVSVNGEEIRQYLLLNNNHDGKRSLRVALTSVRTVCENTLMAGLSSAVMSASIPHRSDIREDAKFTLDIISSVRKQQLIMLEEFRAMALKKVVDSQVDDIIKATYTDPKPTRKQLVAGITVNDASLASMVGDSKHIASNLMSKLQRYGTEYEERAMKINNLRTLAHERVALVNQTSPAIAGTAWSVYQGITEVENWRGDQGKGTSNSILFGERAANMGRAYGACLTVTKG